jgi:hypothetical protein
MKYSFIPRLWRSFMSSLDGEIEWSDLWNRLDERERQEYFRLTVTFPEAEPAIDDVASMDLLAAAVRSDLRGARKRAAAVSALLISSFYLELDSLPENVNGVLHCYGAIRCRLDPYTIIRALHRIYPEGLDFVNTLDSTRYPLTKNDVCWSCKSFRKQVTFTVPSLRTDFEFSLRSTSTHMLRQISSMPQSISWFIKMQELSRPFGSANHGDIYRAACKYCSEPPNDSHTRSRIESGGSPCKVQAKRINLGYHVR